MSKEKQKTEPVSFRYNKKKELVKLFKSHNRNQSNFMQTLCDKAIADFKDGKNVLGC